MFAVLSAVTAGAADGWVPVKALPMNDDESKVALYELPDVLVHTNGAHVTRETWPQRRREMLDLLAREMVGAELPAPEALVVDKFEDKVALGGFAIRRQFRMYFRADRSGPYVDWLLYIPNRPMVRCAWGPKEPMYRPLKGVPVALMLNYDGNHIFSEDDRVPVATNAFNNDAKKGWRLAESDRGLGMRPESRSFVPLRLLMARGWAFLTACYVQVSADHYVHMHENVLSLWPDAEPGTLTSLSAWAWALSRGLDLAAQQPEIDIGKSMVTGCSRLGKTALLAGARDERFAVVCPNQTGGGGIPLWKRNFGENVSMFFHDEARAWFVPSFRRYAGNEAAMPFDMHFLQACIAPRAFLAVGWTEFHFDPKGEFLAVKAASPAWELFGYRGMAGAPEPVPYETNAVGDRIGYARRGGDHCISVLNWLWMLDFADRQFREVM